MNMISSLNIDWPIIHQCNFVTLHHLSIPNSRFVCPCASDVMEVISNQLPFSLSKKCHPWFSFWNGKILGGLYSVFRSRPDGKQSDIVFLNHRNSIFFLASSVMRHAFLFILWLGILFVIHMHEITATFSENGLLFFFWSCIERYINTHHILNKAIIIRGVSYLNFTDRVNRKKANTIFWKRHKEGPITVKLEN